MLQPRPINWRGMPHILGCSEYDDGINRAGLVVLGLAHDLDRGCEQVSEAGDDSQCEQPTVGMRLEAARPRGGYSCPSNSTICSDGTAPSRNNRQEPSSLVRSTMVEGMSRGDWPPSTMRGRQSPNWSRTSWAFVHSDAPCRFADVAVIGEPTARMIASGTCAEGTRRATFPVLAVTLSGSFGSALTMMVSGPGQKRRASR